MENHGETYQIDNLDLQILRSLRPDSRRPFLDIARDLKVSAGTVRGRVNRLKELGVITGSRLQLDYHAIGYDVTCFVGVILVSAKDAKRVRSVLDDIGEVVEIHYTTGNYSLFVKLVARNMRDLYLVLSEKLQAVDGIQSTETFVVLDTSLDRDPPL